MFWLFGIVKKYPKENCNMNIVHFVSCGLSLTMACNHEQRSGWNWVMQSSQKFITKMGQFKLKINTRTQMEKKLLLILKVVQKAQTAQSTLCITCYYHTKMNWLNSKRRSLSGRRKWSDSLSPTKELGDLTLALSLTVELSNLRHKGGLLPIWMPSRENWAESVRYPDHKNICFSHRGHHETLEGCNIQMLQNEG